MTPKQARFVDEYLVDLNATQAAIRAGYKGDPDTVGPRLLGYVGVASAIAERQAERSKRTQIDADWVLRRLAAEAEADLSHLFDSGGNLLPVDEWPKVFRTGLVTGFETVHETEGSGEDKRRMLVRKVKLQDRSKTIEMIGKHVDIQAWRERLEHTGKNGGPITVQRIELVPMGLASDANDAG